MRSRGFSHFAYHNLVIINTPRFSSQSQSSKKVSSVSPGQGDFLAWQVKLKAGPGKLILQQNRKDKQEAAPVGKRNLSAACQKDKLDSSYIFSSPVESHSPFL